MPLFGKFLFWRSTEPAAADDGGDCLPPRLERMVAQQKLGSRGSSLETTLRAMEGEYSAPLYESSVYLSEPRQTEN